MGKSSVRPINYRYQLIYRYRLIYQFCWYGKFHISISIGLYEFGISVSVTMYYIKTQQTIVLHYIFSRKLISSWKLNWIWKIWTQSHHNFLDSKKNSENFAQYLSLSADVNFMYWFQYRYRPIRKSKILGIIGIGWYEKMFIGRILSATPSLVFRYPN